MKNPHKLVCNLYNSKSKVRFWVGDNMHSRQLNEPTGAQVVIYLFSSYLKTYTKHLTRIGSLSAGGVAEQRIAKSPGL